MHNSAYALTDSELDRATDAALRCLAWSEYDFDSDRPLDSFGFSFVSDAFDRMRDEVAYFVYLNSADLNGLEYSQIGHDFILSRNSHGAGFWDRGLGDRGDRLTVSAKSFGEITCFISDAVDCVLDTQS